MKLLVAFLFLPMLSFGQNWVQIWSDEFDGSSLDFTKWEPEIGTGTWGWGNNELQYYTASPNNVFVDTGYLHIVGREQSFQGSNYTSTRIKTEGLFDFQYGRVEARIKVPVDQGLWPAFWMLGSDFQTVGWPFCGEIDIMEHVNNELKVHGTIHYDQWGHMYSGDFEWADASIFHVYELEWDSDEIRWYLDGVQFHQEDISSQSLSREEFHTPFFFILNLAIGGNWPGSPDATTQFPATMLVDYVRVFQEANSVEEIFKPELEISAYPNPASDQLIITSQLDIQTFEVFNLQGAKLASGDGDQINVSNLAVGSYIVEATAVDGSVGRVSFIKE